MKIRIISLLLLSSFFLLSACGQKGPLYHEKPAKPAAEEKAKKSDKEEEKESDEKSEEKSEKK